MNTESYNSAYSKKCEYFLIIFFIIIFGTILLICMIKNDNEHFGSKKIKQNNFANIHKYIDPDDDIYENPMSNTTYPLVVNRIKVSDGMKMILDIKNIIINGIIKYGIVCQKMDGSENTVFAGGINLTLSCITDPYSIEEDLILDITNYITNVIKKKFNINISPYTVIDDLKRVLNLTENIIYPLQYSHLYTVHGEQYFTRRTLSRLVNTNLKVDNALYTVLSRRGITMEVDTDQQIY